MTDCIVKQNLDVILLIDTSTSMRGERIAEVTSAVRDVRQYLTAWQKDNAQYDFRITVITFDTEARFLNGKIAENVSDFSLSDISVGGRSNLHLAYEKLETLLRKEEAGGIMPRYGGVAPIILLLTDGHPSTSVKTQVQALFALPWFRVALRYGIAIGLRDEKTVKCLSTFVGDNGDVIECYDAAQLKNIIKIILLTSSKVKSSSGIRRKSEMSEDNTIRQEIQLALANLEDLEW